MLRAVFWTLRQRRYRGLAAFMLVLALACAAAGTFEVHRYREKRQDNRVLVANTHAPTVPLTSALVSLTGSAPVPAADAIRYRTVSATGAYLAEHQQYVGNVEQGGRRGFYVLTPLRTTAGVALVLRGFVAGDAAGTGPGAIAAPPAGAVTLTARLHDVRAAADEGRLPGNVITAINTARQARRLGAPVFQAYLELSPHQPGSAGLAALPAPPLHNPTGGASGWQLLSYVVQWYAFALLALVAPFLFSRGEAREARRRFLGIDPAAEQFDAVEAGSVQPTAAALGGASTVAGGLAVRSRADLAERGEADPRWQRALRLADRYGVSLGDPSATAVAAADVANRRAVQPGAAAVRDSSAAPHRSQDVYHGAYNDYLWELALADGNLPDVFGDSEGPVEAPAPPPVRLQPRVIDATPMRRPRRRPDGKGDAG